MIQLLRPSRGHVTQWYANTQPDGMPHAGQDYAYTNGVETFPEVYAAADGVVMFAGDSRNLGWPNPWYVNPDFNRADNWDSSAGNLITIRHHQFSADTGYGHLEKCFVKEGDTVMAGQLIAIAGETGNSRGKHLHFFLMFHPFNYNTPTYGCSDPNPYFVGSLAPAGTITPLEEDMPITDADATKIANALLDARRGDATLGQFLTEYRGQHLDTIRVIEGVDDTVLDTVVEGVAGDRITIRQFLAEYRSHVIQVTSGIAAEAAAGGASIEEIRKAVADGLSAGIKVDATVTVGNGE